MLKITVADDPWNVSVRFACMSIVILRRLKRKLEEQSMVVELLKKVKELEGK